MPVRPWPRLSTEPLADYRIFRVRADRCQSPRTGADFDFFVLECADWVNVVALTDDAQVVLVEQYRFGVMRPMIEIPGGVIDPGEDPLTAAARELREETGFVARSIRLLGSVEPNPAIQDNRCFTALAQGCVRVGEPHQEEREDIAVLTRPLADVPRMLASGEISHALVWAAFHHYELDRQGLKADPAR